MTIGLAKEVKESKTEGLPLQGLIWLAVRKKKKNIPGETRGTNATSTRLLGQSQANTGVKLTGKRVGETRGEKTQA